MLHQSLEADFSALKDGKPNPPSFISFRWYLSLKYSLRIMAALADSIDVSAILSKPKHKFRVRMLDLTAVEQVLMPSLFLLRK
jgi:hypothetical protein